MKEILCQNCKRAFIHKKRFPHILKNCGHSICFECIESLVKKSEENHETSIKCPICAKEQFFSNNKAKILLDFPENKLFGELNIFPESSPCCQLNKRNLVCINQKCNSFNPFCENCFEEFHLSCDPLFMFDYKELQNSLKFDIPKTDEIFDVSQLIEKIKNKIALLEKTMIQIVLAFDSVYESETMSIKNVRNDFSTFKMNPDLMSFEVEAEQNNTVRLTLKNNKVLIDSAKYVFQKFDKVFWENCFRDLHRLIFEETNLFSHLKMNDSISKHTILDFLETKNPKIIADFASPEFLCVENFNFFQYFNSLEAFYKNLNPGFVLLQSFDLTDEEIFLIHTFINKAFCEPDIFRNSIERFVQNGLNSSTKMDWHVYLESNQVAKKSKIHKKYGYFQRNGYCLCVMVF